MNDTDYKVFEATARDQLRSVKITRAQWLIAEIILDYSYRLGLAKAWFPDQSVFELFGKMDGKNVSTAIDDLQTAAIITVAPAPKPKFPYGCDYIFQRRDTWPWNAVPLVRKSKETAAASLARWLRGVNEAGGTLQGELFAPDLDIAELLAASMDRPQGGPDRSEPESKCSGHARGAAALDDPSASNSTRPTGAGGNAECGVRNAEYGASSEPANAGHAIQEEDERWQNTNGGVGKTPTVGVGNLPTVPHEDHEDWIGIDESNISLKPLQSHGVHGAGVIVGKLPTPQKLRPAHWPTWQVENRLIRELWQFLESFLGPQATEIAMNGDGKTTQGYGKLWRWRIREYPFCVEKAVMNTERNRSEVRSVGGVLNREFVKAKEDYERKRREQIEAEDAAEEEE